MNNTRMTPTKRLLRWVIEQGGRVPWQLFHARGIELGSPPPAQNSLFGGRVPSMVSDGPDRAVTAEGNARASRSA